MKLLVAADDSGSLKEITCIRGTDTSVQTAPQPDKIETFHAEGIRSRVQKFIVVKPSSSETSVVVTARANGNITIYKENENYDLINTIPENLITVSGGANDQFVALFESHNTIVAATEQGRIILLDLETIYTDDVKRRSISLKAPISAFVAHPEQKGIYAYGGKENDLKIIRLFPAESKDIFSGDLKIEQLFQAKNVKNNKLDLRVPVWVSNILFVELPFHTKSSWRVITTTRYGQVRKYDTQQGKKPLFDKKLSERPLVCVAITPNENEIVCSDTHATTALFDVEKGILVAKYKGSVGAVQDLFTSLKGDKSLLISGALDRYVRVFNIQSREQTVKVFVGSKLSCVWLLDAKDVQSEIVSQAAVSEPKKKKKIQRPRFTDEDDDAMWKELEGNSKRRRVNE